MPDPRRARQYRRIPVQRDEGSGQGVLPAHQKINNLPLTGAKVVEAEGFLQNLFGRGHQIPLSRLVYGK